MQPGHSPVAQVPAFSIVTQGLDVVSYYTLYTLSTGDDERIETVYLPLEYGSSQPTQHRFAIQLIDPSGLILYEQSTPAITATDMSDLLATAVWSRLGNDTAQLPADYFNPGLNGFSRWWANMRLPDLVLIAGASVRLAAYTNYSGEEPPLLVTGATVTTTHNAGTAATTSTIADLIPLLAPIPLDEQGDPQLT